MGIFNRTGQFLKKRIDFREAIGYKHLKANAAYLKSTAKSVFRPQKIKDSEKETFNDAMHRLNMNDEDLQERYNMCRLYFNCFAIFFVAIFVYALYLMFFSTFLGGIVGLALAALVGVQAFKYHFWMFQIKNKKLGCSFAEWRAGVVNKKNNNKKAST